MKYKILNHLKACHDFVSGQDMSQALGVSRTAVWKSVNQLRAEGYGIESVSRRGYKLASEPDKLFPQSVHQGLKAKVFGRDVVYFETIDSTMDEARRLGIEGRREGLVVCAEAQTKGRGRLGRSWISSKGKGLYFSLLLRPRISLAEASCLTLVFAVAVCEAIRRVAGVDARIKWPNDIFIGQKKVAGILTELNAELDRINFIVLGVGVNMAPEAYGSLRDATSLDAESSGKISRVGLLQEMLCQMETYYQLFCLKGFSSVAKLWRSLSCTLGRQVKVVEINKTIEGLAMDIDEKGALLIQQKDGKIVRKISGDVVHLRMSR